MNKEKQKGQVMIMSVLLISSAVLGAATLMGLLVLFQLRQTADAEASARAVFAADAGIERALFEVYRNNHCDEGGGGPIRSKDLGDEFSNGDTEYVVNFDENCTVARAGGRSSRAARAFIIFLEGIESFGNQLDGPPGGDE
ncbi:MAG: hypothetical protein Q8P99_02965 [bacterium]|nr:hypothetical protein [bacterium]MDZ4231179.1 hypothetical protein [Patescibacteria group bacterium]